MGHSEQDGGWSELGISQFRFPNAPSSSRRAVRHWRLRSNLILNFNRAHNPRRNHDLHLNLTPPEERIVEVAAHLLNHAPNNPCSPAYLLRRSSFRLPQQPNAV